MLSYNQVILVGNVGTDVDVKYTGQGTAVTNFRIATNQRYKDGNGELQEKTDWHTVVAWGRMAETAGELLQKGSKVMVVGSLHTRSYDDRDGNTKWVTEVKASFVNAFGGTRQSNDEVEEVVAESDDDVFGPDDDLPF